MSYVLLMGGFVTCRSCACLVKDEDSACPFCGGRVDLVPPAACKDTPTCGCVVDAGALAPADGWTYYPTPGTSTYSGGWLVEIREMQPGCGGCYGSPPARLAALAG